MSPNRQGARRRTALAIAAGLLAAGLIAGLFAAGVIGGGDDNEATDTGEVSVEGGGNRASGPAKEDGGNRGGEEQAGGGESAGDRGNGKGDDASSSDPGSRDEEFRAPEKDKSFFANEAAKSVLNSLGFPNATFAVSGGGEVLTVVVPEDAACAAGPGAVREIVSRLKEIVLFARKVIVKVQSGQPYAAYAASCARAQIPGGGKTLYEISGPAFGGAEAFRVRTKRFTVGYRNTGENLEIYVTEGDRVVKPVIKTSKTGVGSETYRGPGKFVVTANGQGRFAVKVTAG